MTVGNQVTTTNSSKVDDGDEKLADVLFCVWCAYYVGCIIYIYVSEYTYTNICAIIFISFTKDDKLMKADMLLCWRMNKRKNK